MALSEMREERASNIIPRSPSPASVVSEEELLLKRIEAQWMRKERRLEEKREALLTGTGATKEKETERRKGGEGGVLRRWL